MTSATVYRCRDAAGTLLYVGCSIHAATRIPQHRDKPWWPDVATVDCEHFESVEDASAAEKRAIELEEPVYNRMPGRVVTERQLERRRERRAEAAERAERYRQEQAEFHQTTYPAFVVCTNCGRGGPEGIVLRFPKGVAIADHPCLRCGVAGFEQKVVAA